MPKEINLLPQTKLDILQQETTIRIVRTISIGFFIMSICMAIGIFFLNRDTSLANLQAQKQTLHSNLGFLHDKAINNQLLLDRVRKIQSLQKTQASFIADIDIVQLLIPTGVIVDSLTLDQLSLILGVSSPSLEPINTFLGKVNDLYVKKTFFKRITIDNVSADSHTGRYSVAIHADLL
jgi:hypothetical protein